MQECIIIPKTGEGRGGKKLVQLLYRVGGGGGGFEMTFDRIVLIL